MDPKFEPATLSPDRLVVEVFSELTEDVVRERWRNVNVLLRLSMLSGLPMQLESTLNLLLDFAMDLVAHESAIVYLWDDNSERISLAGK